MELKKKKSRLIKRISGIIFVILGSLLIVFGSSISTQVSQGIKKIHKAQAGVNVVRGVSKIHQSTEKIGKAVTSPIQKKIDDGRKETKSFKSLSMAMFVVGIAFCAFGAVLLFFSFTRKNRE